MADIMQISLAPLQGYTDRHFRKAFNSVFTGVDKFYTPYIRYDNKKNIKRSQQQEVLPSNNNKFTIPQVMANNGDDLISLTTMLAEMGYSEANLNLGCPFPMVAKRKLGSGLLAHPKMLDEMLTSFFKTNTIKLSIKMRLGYQNFNEFEAIIPILNKFPLTEVILHPRLGSQMYKGTADIDMFEKCSKLIDHKICYNGDITTYDKFSELQQRLPSIENWMIGRGLLINPFLAEHIKNSNDIKIDVTRFKEFHEILSNEILSALSGSSHFLTKMTAYWEYFSHSFTNSHKIYKYIKKAKSIERYEIETNRIFSQEHLVK